MRCSRTAVRLAYQLANQNFHQLYFCEFGCICNCLFVFLYLYLTVSFYNHLSVYLSVISDNRMVVQLKSGAK